MSDRAGRRATAEEAQKAYAEAAAVLAAIWNLNLVPAAAQVRERLEHGELSAEGIARLAFLALDLKTMPRAQRAARMHAAFAAAWNASQLEEHNKAAALAPQFGWNAGYARRLAAKLGLREKRT
jgi:hypothetical protein